jgi:hypothetical protein
MLKCKICHGNFSLKTYHLTKPFAKNKNVRENKNFRKTKFHKLCSNFTGTSSDPDLHIINVYTKH